MPELIAYTHSGAQNCIVRLISDGGTRYGIRLPSGLTHWFDTEHDARRSQYWPHEEK
jgi:hypothetical protein